MKPRHCPMCPLLFSPHGVEGGEVDMVLAECIVILDDVFLVQSTVREVLTEPLPSAFWPSAVLRP